MKRVSLCLLLSAAIQSLCYGDVTKFATANPSAGGLSWEDRTVLQDFSRFRDVHSTRDLPPAILSLCDGGGDGKLAEPGGNWNATDAIIDPTLPGKRLIWAAVGGDYYVVHYERGGIAHTYHVLVAKLAKADAKPKTLSRAMGGPFKDYAAFVEALRGRKLNDSIDYAR
jgi:hypothetical protein